MTIADVVTVPAGGLPAWAEPDPAAPVVTQLPDGLMITVMELRGDWARVSSPTGWTGWVDARRLVRAPDESGGGRRWPRVNPGAVRLVVFVVGVALAFWLGRGGSSAASGDVLLEPADVPGVGAFATSVATAASVADNPTATTVPPRAQGGLVRAAAAAPGIYSGTRDTPSCDAAALSAALARDAARAQAWAKAAGVKPDQIDRFVAGLTPATLRVDTRLTDYQLSGGRAVAKQAVLQAGTAVLLDRAAMPRVRCASGDPLAQPRAVTSSLNYTGTRWPSFSADTIVVLDPARRTGVLVLIDPRDGSAFGRVLGSAVVMDLDRPPSGVSVVVVEPGGSFAIGGTKSATADLTVTWDDPPATLALSASGGRIIAKAPTTAAPGPHAVTVTGAGVDLVQTVYVIPPRV